MSSPSTRRELNQQLRAAFVAGAEEASLAEKRHGLTEDELERVIARYPVDVPTERSAARFTPMAPSTPPPRGAASY